LFKLYGQPALGFESVQKARAALTSVFSTELREKLANQVPYIELESVDINQVSAADPIVRREQSSIVFEPRFGTVPPFAYGIILNQAILDNDKAVIEATGSTEKYDIQLILGDRRLVRSMATRKEVLWFLRSRPHDVP
jgi:hypothetical protein